MLRILEVLYALNDGGIEKVLYRYLQHMNRDGLQIDFAVTNPEHSAMQTAFEAMGCRVYRLHSRGQGLRQHLSELRAILRAGQYDIVHSHQNEKAFFALRLAKQAGVPVRILHCHNAFPPESLPRRIVRSAVGALSSHYATHLFACSNDAALWLYGRRQIERRGVTILRNAIELEPFAFAPSLRAQIRSEAGVENAFVVGDIGRITYQKDPLRMVRIFAELRKLRPEAVLWMIGSGEMEDALRAAVQQAGLEGCVRLWGSRSDVPKLMQGLDAFVLPSRFEGLGIVYIEAQANGLRAFGSDVPGAREACVTPLMTKIAVDTSDAEWARQIAQTDASTRPDVTAELRAAGYDICENAHLLRDRYLALSGSTGAVHGS